MSAERGEHHTLVARISAGHSVWDQEAEVWEQCGGWLWTAAFAILKGKEDKYKTKPSAGDPNDMRHGMTAKGYLIDAL